MSALKSVFLKNESKTNSLLTTNSIKTLENKSKSSSQTISSLEEPTSNQTQIQDASSTLKYSINKRSFCFIENQMNYDGQHLKTVDASSVNICCDSCGDTFGCIAWSFSNYERKCYLKGSIPEIKDRKYANMTSGIILLF